MYSTIYSVFQKSDSLNVWLWQVRTCTTLHIIKLAPALMYFGDCHQILYKSVLPFSRFSIFTKRCQEVQLPAALLACFLCAVTVFYVNVQHFLLMLSVGISSLGHTELIFIDPVVKVNGSYYRLTTRSGAFCKSECIVTRLVTLTIWKNDWFMNYATLISLSLTEQSSSSNTISYLYLWKRRTLWTSDLNIIIVRLRTSCYWVVV